MATMEKETSSLIASDKVGAVRDLIFPGRTGYVYPCGDTRALSAALRQAFADPTRLSEIGQAAGRRIEQWSPRASAAALTEAIVRTVAGSQVSRQGNGDAVDAAFNADRSMSS